MKCSPSKMWQERSTLWICHSMSKTFKTAPQCGRWERDMKDMFWSCHIFLCELSLWIFSPCEAVLQAEKAWAETMAIWWHFVHCKGKRTAPRMWCKYKFPQVLGVRSKQAHCPGTVLCARHSQEAFRLDSGDKKGRMWWLVVLRRKVYNPDVFWQKQCLGALHCWQSVLCEK